MLILIINSLDVINLSNDEIQIIIDWFIDKDIIEIEINITY